MTVMAGRGGIVPGVDLLLVAGQSNALVLGLGAGDVPTHLQASDSGIKIWNGTAFVTLVNGSNNAVTSGGSVQWGPEAEFAYQYRQTYPSKTLYIVKYAVSATQLAADAGVTDWSPTSSGELFDTMQTLATNARTNIASLNPRSSELWCQGEQDSLNATLATAYSTNLPAFQAASNTRWHAGAVPRRMIMRISPSTVLTFRTAVRAAQDAAASGFTKIIDTDSYPRQGDDVHYTAAGVVSMGADMFTAWNSI